MFNNLQDTGWLQTFAVIPTHNLMPGTLVVQDIITDHIHNKALTNLLTCNDSILMELCPDM